MTWFTENPLPPVVIGIVVGAGLVVGLAKTGKRGFLWGIVATLAVVVVSVVMERMIVTPREAVTATIEEMRAALAANDRATLLANIDPTNIPLRNKVQIDLAQLTVTEAKINELKVDVDESGKFAKADLKGVVHFEGSASTLMVKFVAVRISVDLRKQEPDGKWLVKDASYQVAKSLNDL
jgi:hypothetical protein